MQESEEEPEDEDMFSQDRYDAFVENEQNQQQNDIYLASLTTKYKFDPEAFDPLNGTPLQKKIFRTSK